MSHFSQTGRSPGSPTLSAVMAGLMIFLPIPGIRGALCAMFPVIAQRTWWVFFKSAVLGLTLDLAICVSLAWIYFFLDLHTETIRNPVLTSLQPLSLGYLHKYGDTPLSEAEFFVIMSVWTLGFFGYWNFSWLKTRRAKFVWMPWMIAVVCAVSVPLLLLAVNAVDQYVYKRWYRPLPVETPAAVMLALGYQAAVAVPCAILGHVIARCHAASDDD